MRNPDPNGIPTDTPKGTFYVQSKMPSKAHGRWQSNLRYFCLRTPGCSMDFVFRTGNRV